MVAAAINVFFIVLLWPARLFSVDGTIVFVDYYYCTVIRDSLSWRFRCGLDFVFF